MDIVGKSNDFVLVNKPAGMPSQPDPSGAQDAMTETSELLRALGEPSELWLVHRLDRVVGGLMMFARNKKAAAYMSELFSTEKVEKEYVAAVEGVPPEGLYSDNIYKDSKSGKACVTIEPLPKTKPARLTVRVLDTRDVSGKVYSLILVSLHTGRFHQIRAQLSSRGYPIVGDGKYGSSDSKAKMPALFSRKLVTNQTLQRLRVSLLPDIKEYPWSLFGGYDTI